MPDTTRVEIPEISNRRLGYLARIIRPVKSLTTRPYGRWPVEEVNTYFVRLPKNLREENFLNQPTIGKPLRLVKEAQIATLHRISSCGFRPTIAEVLAQIPNELLDPSKPSGCKIVAFETFLEKPDPEFVDTLNGTGYLHRATTVLLVKGSPIAGTFQTHYS